MQIGLETAERTNNFNHSQISFENNKPVLSEWDFIGF